MVQDRDRSFPISECNNLGKVANMPKEIGKDRWTLYMHVGELRQY